MREYSAYIFDLYGTLADIHTDQRRLSAWRWLDGELALREDRQTISEERKTISEEQQTIGEERQTIGEEGPSEAPAKERRPGALRYAKALREEWFSILRRKEAAAEEPWPEIRIEEVFREIVRTRGLDLKEAEIEDLAYGFRVRTRYRLRAYAHGKELLHALHKAGKAVYLLTNAQRVFTVPELFELGFIWEENAAHEYTGILFDDILISSDEGIRKPDSRFFRRLLEKHDLDPAGCLMIGNDPDSDIRGAASVGIDGYLIQSGISPKDAAEKTEALLRERAGLLGQPALYVQRGMDLRKLHKAIFSAGR